MKLSSKRKKVLFIAGLCVVCIVIVVVIASHFITSSRADNITRPSSTSADNESPTTSLNIDSVELNEDIQPSEQPIESASPDVSTGTDQSIQSDPIKPQAPTSTPKPQGDTTNANTTPTYNSEDTVVAEPSESQAGATQDGKVYVPGFGWQTETGSSGTAVGSDGDINKQVGDMN